jgi:hypothetical protein
MVNEKPVDLMGMDSKNTVMQALLQLGYKVDEIIGKPGPAITFDFNGEMRILKGLPGRSAEVTINNEKSGIHARLQHGDIVEFNPGKVGKSPETFLSEILTPISVTVNGEDYDLLPQATVNGEICTTDVQIKDGDKINTLNYATVADILEKLSKKKEEFINIVLNGKAHSLKVKEMDISRGNRKLELSDKIISGDVISIQERSFTPTVNRLTQSLEQKYCKVLVNAEEMEIPVSSYKITVNGVKAEPDSVLYDGAIVDIELTEQLPKVIDLLGLMDIDSNSLKSFNITVNQKKAAFMDILNAGDQVEITLEK